MKWLTIVFALISTAANAGEYEICSCVDGVNSGINCIDLAGLKNGSKAHKSRNKASLIFFECNVLSKNEQDCVTMDPDNGYIKPAVIHSGAHRYYCLVSGGTRVCYHYY